MLNIKTDLNVSPIMGLVMDIIGDKGYIAGSSVVSLLKPEIIPHDIDIFVKSHEYESVIRELDYHLLASGNSVTYWLYEGMCYKYRIQLICHHYNTPAELIDSFDLTCSMAVVTSPNTILYHTDIDKGVGNIHKIANLAKVFERMLKYKSYGFTIDKSQWDLVASLADTLDNPNFENNYLFTKPLYSA